ncbi:MAG TPA: M14-type cytosolic carboxypeptidase [Lacunisphaera sp.]|nr:M14-type cytosolic carboxypeptidase [Lacunisphaera sp.]
MKFVSRVPALCLLGMFIAGAMPLPAADAAASSPVHFNTAFEGGAIGQVEVIGETEFRVHVPGQQDRRGRNRQATWFYFRMDNVRGRDLKVTFTGYLPSEYNDRPNSPVNGDVRPVYSFDDEHWTHFAALDWDDAKKEQTVRLHPETNSVWLAFVPPYPESRLRHLLEEIGRSPHARVEVIGQSVLGRTLPMVTVTDFATPDTNKKTIWLQARDHAWESPTSFIAEGALKFAVSDDPAARALREKFVVVITPMMDPDGSALGRVRFNANGWDFNRHWDEVDLRDPQWLRQTPEIWYHKKAIRDYAATGRRISLFVHLHNTNAEYMAAQAPTAEDVPRLEKLFNLLVERTQFDPSQPLRIRPGFAQPDRETKPWWVEYGVPVALIEARILAGKKLKGYPTAEQRTAFGRELLLAMAGAVE